MSCEHKYIEGGKYFIGDLSGRCFHSVFSDSIVCLLCKQVHVCYVIGEDAHYYTSQIALMSIIYDVESLEEDEL